MGIFGTSSLSIEDVRHIGQSSIGKDSFYLHLYRKTLNLLRKRIVSPNSETNGKYIFKEKDNNNHIISSFNFSVDHPVKHSELMLLVKKYRYNIYALTKVKLSHYLILYEKIES